MHLRDTHSWVVCHLNHFKIYFEWFARVHVNHLQIGHDLSALNSNGFGWAWGRWIEWNVSRSSYSYTITTSNSEWLPSAWLQRSLYSCAILNTRSCITTWVTRESVSRNRIWLSRAMVDVLLTGSQNIEETCLLRLQTYLQHLPSQTLVLV